MESMSIEQRESRVRDYIRMADGMASRHGRDYKGFGTAAMTAYTALVELRRDDPDLADRIEIEFRGRIVAEDAVPQEDDEEIEDSWAA
jgi:hypothetical protein